MAICQAESLKPDKQSSQGLPPHCPSGDTAGPAHFPAMLRGSGAIQAGIFSCSTLGDGISVPSRALTALAVSSKVAALPLSLKYFLGKISVKYQT